MSILINRFKKIGAKGFTTVEILVTLIVASLLIISINTVYTTQLYINQRTRDTTIANSFVEGKIERLRSQGFLTQTNGTTDLTSELPDELNHASGSLVISSYNASVKKVDISVTYNDQGTEQTASYTTYIGELGVGQY